MRANERARRDPALIYALATLLDRWNKLTSCQPLFRGDTCRLPGIWGNEAHDATATKRRESSFYRASTRKVSARREASSSLIKKEEKRKKKRGKKLHNNLQILKQLNDPSE